MKTHYYSTLLAILSVALLSACASSPPYTPPAFQAEAIDTTAYAPRVDAFTVILDASSSMNQEYQGRSKFDIARDLVSNLNQTIPALDYRTGLVAFGSGRCIGGKDAQAVYGLAPYQGGDFADGLATVTCAAGITPMGEGLDTGGELLSAESGQVAVILVSDFWNIEPQSVVDSVARLNAVHGGNLCLHTIKVGDYIKADRVIAAISADSGCGSAVNADSLGSSAAVADYVKDLLLAPVAYQKHSVSAEVLFDFDKSVLKPGGKTEIHRLDEGIKAKGLQVTDIDIVGHTDSIGSAAYNQGLSERRAMAVKDYMVSDGIDAGIIDASGQGENQPVASNETSSGRTQNRRVDIHVGAAQATH